MTTSRREASSGIKSFAAALGILSLCGILPGAAGAVREKIQERAASPYLGAIVVDADDGSAVFENNADELFYPASIVKLMMLLIIQEKIETGSLSLSDPVRVTAQAARMGGSQVYLKEGETFTIEELLYALMIQSANDAAVALAIHVAGSTDGFLKLMNDRARELGMKSTVFHSAHGLPPTHGQDPDISTPRDIALLSRELLRHPEILKYTSAQLRGFRDGRMEMRSHNGLLGNFEGCDGLKTGYFARGGYSIAATAKRNNNRFIAVVGGSRERLVRNAKTRELLAQAFSTAAPKQKAIKGGEAVSHASGAARGDSRRGALKPILLMAFALAMIFFLQNFWKRHIRRGPHGGGLR